MSKKVTFAKFHQGLFAPGLGNVGDTLPAMGKTIDNLAMSRTDSILSISGSFKGVKCNIEVPLTNVFVMVVVDEEPVKAAPVKKA